LRVDLDAAEERRSSQNGEDGVIAAILRCVGAPGRFFVEVGTEAGDECNCRALAEQGWAGVFFEADEACARALAERWAHRPDVGTVRHLIAPATVQGDFRAAGVPSDLDVLSIDIDGADWYVWEALEHWAPRLVVIEYNGSLPLDATLVQPPTHDEPWDGTRYFGAALGALEWLAGRKGYGLVHTEAAGVNAFFVRADLVATADLPRGDTVRRRAANYFGTGEGHPPDPHDRPWVDVSRGSFRG